MMPGYLLVVFRTDFSGLSPNSKVKFMSVGLAPGIRVLVLAYLQLVDSTRRYLYPTTMLAKDTCSSDVGLPGLSPIQKGTFLGWG